MIINVCFIKSDRNCTDLNSKISADPILVTNSKMWRSGISHFLGADFPEESRIFLSVVNGDFHWNEHKIDFNVQNCSYCSPDAANICLCVSCTPPEAASNFVASLFTEPKDWEDGAMLSNLPPVNHDHVERLKKRHSLPHLISLVSRILFIRGTQELRNYLGLAETGFTQAGKSNQTLQYPISLRLL